MFSAFIVAPFTEMHGFPLTIYLLSGRLTKRYPGVAWLATIPAICSRCCSAGDERPLCSQRHGLTKIGLAGGEQFI